jgi:c-di-GMP-binding flagellar brake protein YcgR
MSEDQALPPVNQIVHVTIEKAKTQRSFSALVDSVTESDRIRLRVPLRYDISDLKKDQSVTLIYNRIDAHYTLRTKIESLQITDIESNDKKPAMLTLHPPTQVERIQRRQFFRHMIEIPVHFFKVILPKNFETDPSTRTQALAAWEAKYKNPIKGLSSDMGGGGMNLLCNQELETGDVLFLSFSLKGLPLKLAGKAKRCSPSQTGDGYAFSIGIEFLGLTQAEQTEIIRFLFHEQQLRQKHLFE